MHASSHAIERDPGTADHRRITAIEATRVLRATLAEAQVVLAGAATGARVFSPPLWEAGMDNPPTAPVSDLDGAAAIERAISVLIAADYRDGQHPKATRRAAGVLWVADEPDVRAVIAQVNADKADLERAMHAMGHAMWQRWYPHIKTWHRLNRLQAYHRRWRVIDAPLRRLAFGWAGQTTGIEQLRIAALIERLARQFADTGHPAIEAEAQRLAGFDGNEVVVARRPIAPTPQANVVTIDGARWAFKAPSPVIATASIEVIAPLHDHVPNPDRAKRDDMATEDTPLVAAHHVYRYLAAHRFHLPRDPVPVRISAIEGGLHVSAKHINVRLADPGYRATQRAAQAAADARGAVRGTPEIDGVRVVAANRVNAYLDAGTAGVWRVPIKDLARACQAASGDSAKVTR
jgi:hypothetical protein